jgi:hypothetical protein
MGAHLNAIAAARKALCADFDTAGCARDTTGAECAKLVCGDYGGCSYGNACVNSGERSRTCTPQVCANEQCGAGTSYAEPTTAGCDRNTNERTCGDNVCDEWGACQWAETCSQSASQYRNCSAQVCASGAVHDGHLVGREQHVLPHHRGKCLRFVEMLPVHQRRDQVLPQRAHLPGRSL